MAHTTRWLLVGEVARACGVSTRTVRGWVERGALACFRLPGRDGPGQRRFDPAEVRAFIARTRIPHRPEQDEILGPPTLEATP